MSRRLKIFFGIIIIILIIVQFIPAELPEVNTINEGDLLVNEEIPEDVQMILRNSCYDCHSNETVYPWYSYVAPASWLVIRDTNEGREHLNFSDWQSISKRKKIKHLDEMAEEVEKGAMPLPVYTVIHRNAKMDDEDKEKLFEWATQYSNKILGE
jgi:hypothetical protein